MKLHSFSPKYKSSHFAELRHSTSSEKQRHFRWVCWTFSVENWELELCHVGYFHWHIVLILPKLELYTFCGLEDFCCDNRVLHSLFGKLSFYSTWDKETHVFTEKCKHFLPKLELNKVLIWSIYCCNEALEVVPPFQETTQNLSLRNTINCKRMDLNWVLWFLIFGATRTVNSQADGRASQGDNISRTCEERCDQTSGRLHLCFMWEAQIVSQKLDLNPLCLCCPSGGQEARMVLQEIMEAF